MLSATVLVGASAWPAAPPARAVGDCPDVVDPADFSTERNLAALNQVLADAGPRPTASPAHQRYIDSIERELQAIGGFDIRSDRYTIDRWLEKGARLTVRGKGKPRPIRVAGAVPYSRAATVRGPLVYVPPGTPIASVDVAGKVVVRDRVISGGQQAIFLAVADYVHDPDASIDFTGNYERDVSAYEGIRTDLAESAAGRAAGLVFAASVPHRQAFSYAPYHGIHHGVPAVQVGVDEGEQLKAAAGKTVELTVQASRDRAAPTRNLVATLPGLSPERIVVSSHTDGMNAVWDNGPVGMLALARYFSGLPIECRPRTLEFGFTTAHLFQSALGADRYAEELSAGYDAGTVAVVLTVEHLGAQEFLAFPRTGRPGFELRPTGESEIFVTFSGESPVTKAALISAIVRRDLRRTFALRGADAPEARVPPHHSYGGEGGVYHQALLPTIAAITGPNTLFKPQFSQDELLDVELMRRQAMAFGDLVLTLDDVPRELIAGADLAYREVGAGPLPGAEPASAHAPFFCDVFSMVAAAAG